MFGGFEEAQDAKSRKRWFASTGTSVLIFVAVGIGLVVLAEQQTSEAKEEPPIDVTFRGSPEPETKPEPPPPPPPPPPKSHAPRANKPGKVAPLQPEVIPETRPDEAEPTGHFDATVGQEEYGDGLGGAAPVAAAPPPPPPPPAPVREERIPDPISEVDPGVVAPRAKAENAMPVYPESARKKGVEAEVILEIEIDAKGDVIAVEVIRGAEPFASAAKAAVETWHYTPAVVDGKPSAFVKLVKIPFRLHA